MAKLKLTIPALTVSYFPVFVFLASLVYILQNKGVSLHPIINNYLNDLLCMPIVLFTCQYVLRKLKSDSRIQIPLRLVFLLTIGYALFFEYYLPQVQDRYTADYIDIILYFAGAVFFYSAERNMKSTTESTGVCGLKNVGHNPKVKPKLTFEALSSSKSESNCIIE